MFAFPLQRHEVGHQTNQIANNTNQFIKDLARAPQASSPVEYRQRKLLQERLTEEFLNAIKGFQAIQRKAALKEKESYARARRSTNSSLVDPFNGPDGNQFDDDDQPQRTAMQMEMDDEVDLAALREREQQIQQLERDIVDVNKIFKDVAMMVHDQGEVIDSIETNVEQAAIQVEHGGEELRQARVYQSKARRKTCWLVLILLVVLAVVAVIIVLNVKK